VAAWRAGGRLGGGEWKDTQLHECQGGKPATNGALHGWHGLGNGVWAACNHMPPNPELFQLRLDVPCDAGQLLFHGAVLFCRLCATHTLLVHDSNMFHRNRPVLIEL
jgi:hypothetical protein